jgi:hypothetical protein
VDEIKGCQRETTVGTYQPVNKENNEKKSKGQQEHLRYIDREKEPLKVL